MEYRNIEDREINDYKDIIIENQFLFNLLNQDMYKKYFNMPKILRKEELENIKIVLYQNKALFIIWIDNRIYGTFIRSLIPLFNLEVYKEVYYQEITRLIENKEHNNKVFLEYITKDNKINNYILENLEFKNVETLIEMNLDIRDRLKINTNLKNKNNSIEEMNLSLLKYRVSIQNEIFDAKNRYPISKSDIFLDMKSRNFIKELSFFYKKGIKRIGYCQIGIYEGGYYLINFGIIPRYRQYGYGMDFLYQVISKAREYGIKNIKLTVHKENFKAINLYEKFGFKKSSSETTWHYKINY